MKCELNASISSTTLSEKKNSNQSLLSKYQVFLFIGHISRSWGTIMAPPIGSRLLPIAEETKHFAPSHYCAQCVLQWPPLRHPWRFLLPQVRVKTTGETQRKGDNNNGIIMAHGYKWLMNQIELCHCSLHVVDRWYLIISVSLCYITLMMGWWLKLWSCGVGKRLRHKQSQNSEPLSPRPQKMIGFSWMLHLFRLASSLFNLQRERERENTKMIDWYHITWIYPPPINSGK